MSFLDGFLMEWGGFAQKRPFQRKNNIYFLDACLIMWRNQ